MTAAAQVAPDVDRTEARRVLLAELDRHTNAGRVIPCRVWQLAGWTSEDVEEQQLAASLCHRCPALEPCRTYGLAFPLEHGVYGSMTDHERRPRLGSRPKTDRKVA